MAKPYILITLEYPPQVGGVANYYANIVLADATNSIAVIDNGTGALTKPWLKIFITLWRRQKREIIRKIIVGQILPVGTVVWLWHALFKTPYIVYTHGMDITLPQHYARKKWLMRRILSSAEAIVTVSQFSADRLDEFLPGIRAKISIIPPAPHISHERFPAKLKAAPSNWQTPYMLSVSRLVKRKGLAEAIVAFANLPDYNRTWHYYIAGEGVERAKLEALIEQYHMQNRVHLLGSLPDETIAQLYAGCSFFVLPAMQLSSGDFEGFGTVILEANSFGKPAIGVRSGGVSDAIQHQVTGWLVEPNNQSALIEAMTIFCAQPQLVEQLGATAKHWVRQQTWTSKAIQLQALLER